MLRTNRLPSRRGGFSLLELMVVIAIIMVLMALGIGGAYSVLQGQRTNRTEDFIRTIDKLLAQHWRTVVLEAGKEFDQGLLDDSSAVVTMAGFDRNRAKVIWIKFRLMEAFPQSYAEINNPWVYQTDPVTTFPYIPAGMQRYNASYVSALKNSTKTQLAKTESAACLYLALRESRGGSRLEEDHLAANIMDTDNDNIKELVDSWGNPLTFIRFPISTTQYAPAATIQLAGLSSWAPPPPVLPQPPVLSTALLQELNTLNPNRTKKGQQFGDPEDPDGYLQLNKWYLPVAQGGTAQGQTFQLNVHTVANNTLNAAQQYFIPVIISNGSDEVFYDPTAPPGSDGTADNIYSWRLRPAFKGN